MTPVGAMRKELLFTITTGRSGTCFLSRLLQRNVEDAAVFHERVDYDAFGVHTPDVSHLLLFNSVGNVPKVRRFWVDKLSAAAAVPQRRYIETSHMLAKAGLVENLDLLTDRGHEVRLLILRRNRFDIFWSLVDRGEYRRLGGHTWLHWLDPRCRNRIVGPSVFLAADFELGGALWYVTEVFVRAEYYRLLLQDHPSVHVHDVHLEEIAQPSGAARLLASLGIRTAPAVLDVPPPMNERGGDALTAAYRARARQFYEAHAIDDEACRALAQQFHESGARLGDGGLCAPSRSSLAGA